MDYYKVASDYKSPRVDKKELEDGAKKSKKEGFVPEMPIDKLIPNRYQPRTKWDPEKLMDLADSIRENGIIEPIIVSKTNEGKYEIIAGERRHRAAKLAGLKTVPVVVKEATPQQMLELAVVENIQRADLNPLEEALAFNQLSSEFNLTHEQIANKLGYSRPAIVNKIRLLQLPDEVKLGLLEGKVSEGHARALLGLKSDSAIISLYTKVVRENLSVRETEKWVRKLNIGMGKNKLEKEESLLAKVNMSDYNLKFREVFKSNNIRLKHTKNNKIKLEVSFSSVDEVEDFLDRTK